MTPSPPRRARWIAIWSSVTVSMGEERSGVLREIRLVTGESSVTSEAAKPVEEVLDALQRGGMRGNTNVARQD